ncbi:nucleoside hydrolase [Psychromonas sp. KJ10-10]|uniref:nucleoside hydrolase n=1 Tax=Psychromonas sp. KJ10-10 TaxID=3391823 RepID=UPI0039B6218C
MTRKIILDSDPGIDDAMAILFAEANSTIDLMAITTVYGNAMIENATNNALFLKKKFNLKADIVKGASKPITKTPVGPTVIVHGETGFGDMLIPKQDEALIDSRPAYQYIIDMVKENPGEITLVAIGPLTNLALALKAAPEIVNLVKEVVIMGGAFGENGHRGNVTPYAEANIHDDPHVADAVFCAPWPVVIIGLDVTQQSFFSTDYLKSLCDQSNEVGEFMWQVNQYYLQFYSKKLNLDGCFVHDPSAIAYVINPDLFTLRKGAVRVVTEGPAEAMTIQKLDDIRYPHDEWSDMPSQQVGIAVKDTELLDLFRQDIIDYANNKV